MKEDDPKTQDFLYKQPFKRLIKQHEKHSSDKAVELLKTEIETYTNRILGRAISYSDHADRKTIKQEDMKKAINQLKELRTEK